MSTLSTWNCFPNLFGLEKRMQLVLLDAFIQLGLHVVDTVPAGTGVMQVILQD